MLLAVGLTTDLHVDNPAEVAGHAVLRTELGGDGRTLVVMSGIAIPEFEIDDDQTNHQMCRVHLGEPGERMQQASIEVGLASISNDNTEFVFAVDSVSLDRDPATDQLVLSVQLAVAGKRSFLHRFSYQVVLVEQVVPGEITGSLIWSPGTFTPVPLDSATVATRFSFVVHDGAAGAAGAVVANGTITSVVLTTLSSGQGFRATYRVDNAPLDRLISVACDLQGFPSNLVARPTADGVDTVTLTAAQPTATGVDFTLADLGVA